MHRTEPTAQQNLALQLAEKLGSLVENNERVFDHKQGTYGGYFRGECFHLLCTPGVQAPSLRPLAFTCPLPSLSYRPEGWLPQKRGLHAPGWLSPAAVSNSLLITWLLSPWPRPFNLGVLSHTPVLKICLELLQFLLVCVSPQRCVRRVFIFQLYFQASTTWQAQGSGCTGDLNISLSSEACYSFAFNRKL